MKTLESKFDTIYKSNYPKVIRLCLGYVNGDVAQAKDLAQEVFIKVWQNLDSFRNESSISTWIYRITVNTCLVGIRKNKRVSFSNQLQHIESEDENTVADHKDQQLRQLYKCINKLNKDNKAIILLELEGLPQKEIAKVIGISHEAVRVRVLRIKEKLTKCVKNDKF